MQLIKINILAACNSGSAYNIILTKERRRSSQVNNLFRDLTI